MMFSIIIPTRDRAPSLKRTLESLLSLEELGVDREILVVDNGSRDDTSALVAAIQERNHPYPIRYFLEPVPGLLSGRHRGALEARGDICIYLDDDVRLGSRWLSAISDAFRDPAVHLVGGPSRPLFESAPPPWLDGFFSESEEGRHCIWLSLIDGGGAVREIDPCYVWGLNYAIRKESLLRFGGFHPDTAPKALHRFQGDGETGLSLSLKEAGAKALYHPEAEVLHEVPDERLTEVYFAARGFFEGVAQSYTEIRRTGKSSAPVLGKPMQELHRLFSKAWDGILGRRKGIRDLAALHLERGYAFHQREVWRDPTLLEWVMRKDYWDYRLPTLKNGSRSLPEWKAS